MGNENGNEDTRVMSRLSHHGSLIIGSAAALLGSSWPSPPITCSLAYWLHASTDHYSHKARPQAKQGAYRQMAGHVSAAFELRIRVWSLLDCV